MSEVCQRGRTRRGRAAMLFPLIVAAGCQQLPVPRANTAPIHLPMPLPAGDRPSPNPSEGDAPTVGEGLPPLPGSPLAPPTTTSLKPTPTPIIDEAVARLDASQALELASTATVEGLESTPATGGVDPSSCDACDLPEAQPEPSVASSVASPREKKAAGAARIDPEKPAEPPSPREVWREGLEKLRSVAQDQARGNAAPAQLWPLRARVLDALADDEAGSALWKTLLTSLLPEDGDSAAVEPAVARRIKEAVAALEDQAPLEIADLRLCRKVNGFANFEPLDASSCKAGQPLIVYCEVAGLRSRPVGDAFHSRLSSRVELLVRDGGKPVWSQVLGTAEDQCRRRRRDYFVNYRITLPDDLPPGDYDLRLTQTDEIAARSATSGIKLTIRP